MEWVRWECGGVEGVRFFNSVRDSKGSEFLFNSWLVLSKNKLSGCLRPAGQVKLERGGDLQG